MCGGLAPAHSGYSPRRAVMGNRHIPEQRLPTPCFQGKENRKKNVRDLVMLLGEAGGSSLGSWTVLRWDHGIASRSIPGRVA